MKKLALIMSILVVSGSAIASELASVPVALKQVDSRVYLDGHVEAVQESTVSAQISARIKAIHVDVDDRVDAGKLLIELDDTEIKAKLAKAQASLKVAEADSERAESEYQRYLDLSKKNYVSQEQLVRHKNLRDVSRQQIAFAKAQISEAEQQLTYATIIAPYGGVVTIRHVEVGETPQMGQPLLTGYSLDQNRIYLDLPQALLADVTRSQRIFALDSQGDWQALSNLTIFSSADPQTHTVRVRAAIDNARFNHKPGSFIPVAVETNPRDALLVPQTAVVKQGDLNAVYVLVSDKAVLRQVLLGEQYEGQYEVISGLIPGELVLADSATYLSSQEK